MKQKATFAAGCFWGVEALFSRMDGVLETRVGYCGGKTEDPTYEEVCTGITGHAEAIEIEFDSSKVSYEELLDLFFKKHDPTQLNRQGVDIGTQYRSVVFFHTEQQKESAEFVIKALTDANVFTKEIVTEVVESTTFYPAEEYHQKYFLKHPGVHCHI